MKFFGYEPCVRRQVRAGLTLLVDLCLEVLPPFVFLEEEGVNGERWVVVQAKGYTGLKKSLEGGHEKAQSIDVGVGHEQEEKAPSSEINSIW